MASAPAVVTLPGRRRGRTALYVALALGLVAALFVAVLATRKSAETKAVDSPLLGKPAPSVAGAALDDSRVDLTAMRGKWVVLNFFATWCTPCRREHPELDAFTRAHAAKGDAAILAVIYSDSRSAVRAFFEKQGGDWPVVSDPDGRVALDFGVGGIPETFLIDPNGNVAAKIIGGVTAPGLDAILTKAAERGA
jgi:cytochrome c biogenesis protein CcmG/thiol:disulfide interchange protein DsbE